MILTERLNWVDKLDAYYCDLILPLKTAQYELTLNFTDHFI